MDDSFSNSSFWDKDNENRGFDSSSSGAYGLDSSVGAEIETYPATPESSEYSLGATPYSPSIDTPKAPSRSGAKPRYSLLENIRNEIEEQEQVAKSEALESAGNPPVYNTPIIIRKSPVPEEATEVNLEAEKTTMHQQDDLAEDTGEILVPSWGESEGFGDDELTTDTFDERRAANKAMREEGEISEDTSIADTDHSAPQQNTSIIVPELQALEEEMAVSPEIEEAYEQQLEDLDAQMNTEQMAEDPPMEANPVVIVSGFAEADLQMNDANVEEKPTIVPIQQYVPPPAMPVLQPQVDESPRRRSRRGSRVNYADLNDGVDAEPLNKDADFTLGAKKPKKSPKRSPIMKQRSFAAAKTGMAETAAAKVQATGADMLDGLLPEENSGVNRSLLEETNTLNMNVFVPRGSGDPEEAEEMEVAEKEIPAVEEQVEVMEEDEPEYVEEIPEDVLMAALEAEMTVEPSEPVPEIAAPKIKSPAKKKSPAKTSPVKKNTPVKKPAATLAKPKKLASPKKKTPVKKTPVMKKSPAKKPADTSAKKTKPTSSKKKSPAKKSTPVMKKTPAMKPAATSAKKKKPTSSKKKSPAKKATPVKKTPKRAATSAKKKTPVKKAPIIKKTPATSAKKKKSASSKKKSPAKKKTPALKKTPAKKPAAASAKKKMATSSKKKSPAKKTPVVLKKKPATGSAKKKSTSSKKKTPAKKKTPVKKQVAKSAKKKKPTSAKKKSRAVARRPAKRRVSVKKKPATRKKRKVASKKKRVVRKAAKRKPAAKRKTARKPAKRKSVKKKTKPISKKKKTASSKKKPASSKKKKSTSKKRAAPKKQGKKRKATSSKGRTAKRRRT